MAQAGITLVGAAGAVAITISTVAGALAPTFGQATTAGNFVICLTGTTPTTSDVSLNSGSGWNAVQCNGSNGSGFASAWWKQNCAASETAPTFTNPTGNTSYAVLVEFADIERTVKPYDVGGLISSIGASPAVISTASTNTVLSPSDLVTGTDKTGFDLALVWGVVGGSKSATWTLTPTWSPSGSTNGTIGTTAATKDLQAFFAYYAIFKDNPATSSDQVSLAITPSTGTYLNGCGSAVSWLPAGPLVPSSPPRFIGIG